MSTWVIGGRFGGMAFRESKTHAFKDAAPFLPHVIKATGNQTNTKKPIYVNNKGTDLYK
jgi:hypothetical protein